MKLIFTKTSLLKLEDIKKYITKDSAIKAENLIIKIKNSILLLQKNPLIGVIGRLENTREFYIPSTNYFIVYKITKNELYIVNIIHTSTNYGS
jgi:addiction module RelE/StbE family toxin